MATILRKLAHKSTMNFGKYADMTVHQILSLNHQRILRWYYYNCSNITFTDEILDELHIPVEFRIDKPGKNPELCEQLDEICEKKAYAYVAHQAEINGEDPEVAMMIKHRKIDKTTRKRSWRKYCDFRREDSRWNTKACLQAINHGHI